MARPRSSTRTGYRSAAQLATRWGIHLCSVGRTLERYGIPSEGGGRGVALEVRAVDVHEAESAHPALRRRVVCARRARAARGRA